jgi:hypothetical protein
MPRFRDAEDLSATERERARAVDRTAEAPSADVGLRPIEQHLLGLQQSAGNRAVVQLLRSSGAITRGEEEGAEPEDGGEPDWSAPIEQEADTRSEPFSVQRHDDEETVPGYRAESGSATSVRQRASGRATAQRQATLQRQAATFPTFPQVRWNATVSNAMWAAWAATLRAATATQRREQGFWVQWDNTTTRNANGDMRVVGAVTAPAIGPTVTASVQLGARPADAGNWVTVASFHTHTPTRFRTVGRVVGPSGADGTADTNDNVTGLVYDYTAVAGGAIPARHPTWSAAQVYHSGPNSRV